MSAKQIRLPVDDVAFARTLRIVVVTDQNAHNAQPGRTSWAAATPASRDSADISCALSSSL
jgi:hypothetical protein